MKKNIIKTLAVIVLALLMSCLVQYDFSSLSYFSPQEKDNDFLFSDFIQTVAKWQGAPTLDERVIIVDIADDNREQIIKTVALIDSFRPAAIGLDVLFRDYQPTTDSLIRAIVKQTPELVLPCYLSNYEDKEKQEIIKPYCADSLNAMIAAINLQGENQLNSVRETRLFYELASGQRIESFPVAVLSVADKNAYRRLCVRAHEVEEINYANYTHSVLSPDEIVEHHQIIKGAIVLVGSLNEINDIHKTPVSSKISGVEIHANVISMMLHDAYFSRTSPWFDWSLAIILCFAMILLKYCIQDKPYCDILIRIIQIVVLWLLIVITFKAFKSFGVLLGAASSLLMVALGLMAKEIVDGGWWSCKKLANIAKRLFKKSLKK